MDSSLIETNMKSEEDMMVQWLSLNIVRHKEGIFIENNHSNIYACAYVLLLKKKKKRKYFIELLNQNDIQ